MQDEQFAKVIRDVINLINILISLGCMEVKEKITALS
jgi:hypothetical protein